MATMEDIAKKLGITKGTVSKALSGAPDVSDAMRNTILETAVELGYTRIVRSGTKRRLCIFVERMEYSSPSDFGWGLVTGFRKSAEPAGFSVDVIPLTVAMQKEEHYDAFMMRNNYLGAFFLGLNFSDPWMQDFKTCKLPAVLYDNLIKYNPVISTVGVDNEEGMELAVAVLKKLGHRKIGYLSGALGSLVFQQRYLAYLHALRQNGLSEDHSIVGKAYHVSDNISTNLPRLLQKGCTAIICSHDQLAHAVLIHCSEIGIHVPRDISIIGFDDLPLCQFTSPPLSSIRQNTEELGKSAYHALNSQLGHIPICSLLLHGELVERGSIGPAAVPSP